MWSLRPLRGVLGLGTAVLFLLGILVGGPATADTPPVEPPPEEPPVEEPEDNVVQTDDDWDWENPEDDEDEDAYDDDWEWDEPEDNDEDDEDEY